MGKKCRKESLSGDSRAAASSCFSDRISLRVLHLVCLLSVSSQLQLQVECVRFRCPVPVPVLVLVQEFLFSSRPTSLCLIIAFSVLVLVCFKTIVNGTKYTA